MSKVIDFLKRMFGVKPTQVDNNLVRKTTPDNESVIKNQKSDLNAITLKMGDVKDKPVISEVEKPKRKRYYKKKTTNKEKPAEAKKETNKKPEKKSVNTEAKTNGTTKKRYRPKKSKQAPTVQPESRSDQ